MARNKGTSKIVKYGLENYIRDLKEKQDLTYDQIAVNCNRVIPNGDRVSESTIRYYFRTHEISYPDAKDLRVIDKIDGLANRIFQLADEAEILLYQIKDQGNHKDRIQSIKATNEVLRTCLNLARELKEPATKINIDIEQRTLRFIIDITEKLPKESQKMIQEQIESAYNSYKEVK